MSIGNIDHWYELVVWLALIVIGPGGAVAAVLAWHDKRQQAAQAASKAEEKREREAERTESIDLHARVFDESMQALEDRLRGLIDPIAQRQVESTSKLDEVHRDVTMLAHKVDTNADRHDKLERETYSAIAMAESVIAKHHPEDIP